jgi:hypothetical protein
MRLLRVRFTIRTLMLAVAVVGLAFGIERLCRRVSYFHSRAEMFALMEQVFRDMERFAADSARRHAEWAREDVAWAWAYGAERHVSIASQTKNGVEARREQREAESWAARADRACGLVRKYKYAARHPWLPVEPDPPEPE